MVTANACAAPMVSSLVTMFCSMAIHLWIVSELYLYLLACMQGGTCSNYFQR